jgi:hypothetical protein
MKYTLKMFKSGNWTEDMFKVKCANCGKTFGKHYGVDCNSSNSKSKFKLIKKETVTKRCNK